MPDAGYHLGQVNTGLEVKLQYNTLESLESGDFLRSLVAAAVVAEGMMVELHHSIRLPPYCFRR